VKKRPRKRGFEIKIQLKERTNGLGPATETLGFPARHVLRNGAKAVGNLGVVVNDLTAPVNSDALDGQPIAEKRKGSVAGDRNTAKR